MQTPETISTDLLFYGDLTLDMPRINKILAVGCAKVALPKFELFL